MSGALTLLLVFVGIALSVSFLCSILEATLLTVRVPELTARAQGGERPAATLLHLKTKRIDDAISSILILNTMAHTVGATMAGKQAEVVWDEPWVTVFAVVLTLLVLVVTEIIPKTIGTVYARNLVGFAARTIAVMVKLLRPVLVFTNALTGLLTHGKQEAVSRGELSALVSMAVRSGTLEAHESNTVNNVLRLEKVLVEDVMTPRTVVKMLPADATVDDLIHDDDAHIFSRIPLRQSSKDEVVGYIVQREVIVDALRSGERGRPLSRWSRNLRFIPENATLAQALKLFLEEREHLLMVVDEYGGVSGLVTLEDLLESILGAEIIDEMDRVEDLRKSAAELRDRRLKRHQKLLLELRENEYNVAPGSDPQPQLPDDDHDEA